MFGGDDFMDMMGYMIVNGEFDEDRATARRTGSFDDADDDLDEFDDEDDEDF